MAQASYPPPSDAASGQTALDALHWLKQLPLFADTKSETLELFAPVMQERAYAPGEVLFQQGDSSSEVYLITHGDTVIRIEHEGRVVATDSVAAGSCVGEMAALTGKPRSATVSAGSQGAVALILPGPRFRDLLLLKPSLGVNLLAMMSERLRQTELRKQNAALAQRADELGRSVAAADATSRAKADLLASMSHELRTPLNGIIGLTELVLGSSLTASQREYLELVRDSGESLLALINDILDMSKIEAGRMEFNIQPFELRDRLTETLKTLAVRAHRKGIELACRVGPDVPDRLCGDLPRLRQVIINLVGNAIKFTERGEIVVEVACAERTPQNVVLQFTVRDTGLGIPKEKLAQLFQPYAQADATIARDYGGTGLGLSISAGLVRGMGGRIWAESMVGVGSAFHFTVPLVAADDESSTPPVLPAGRRVLLVQPHATTAHIHAEMLQSWGVKTTTVANLEGALNELAVQPHSHLLIDASGCEVRDCHRLSRAPGGPAILMLLTANQLQEATLCDELHIPHLLKPVKPSELLGFLNSPSLEPSTTAAVKVPLPNEGSTTAAAGARILLAEDGFVNQKLAMSLLTKRGYQVTIAATGREALAILDRESFDLVLMDIHMPEMDGMEATRAIRNREKQSQSRIPIIAMTASNSRQDIQHSLTAGMDAFVSKPVPQESLYTVIEEQLAAARAASDQSIAQVVNWPAALLQAGGDHQQLEERVALLMQEIPRVQRDLVAAADAGDFPALEMAAHTLRVALGGFGAARIAQLAEQLEAISSSQDPAIVSDLVIRLQEEAKLLMKALQRFRA